MRAELSAEYPKTEELPPLPSQIEKFGEELQQAQVSGPRLQFMDPNATRFWFIGDPGTRLIQVQRDRFVINWRKVTGDEAYPRYEKENTSQNSNVSGRSSKSSYMKAGLAQ